MGCPDRIKDKMIIAEIEQIKKSKRVTKQPEFQTEMIIIEGDLFSLFSSVNENEVANIAKISDKHWEVQLVRRV